MLVRTFGQSCVLAVAIFGLQSQPRAASTNGGIPDVSPDDNIPGVALPPSPFTGTLEEITDVDDVYSVALQPGKQIVASINGGSGTDFMLFLYRPGAPDLTSGTRIARSGYGAYPRRLQYGVPLGEGGTYYLDLRASSGAGNYTLTWQVTDAEPDYNIPGVAIPPSPIAGALDETTDREDVYAIQLQTGDKFIVTISADAATDFDMFLFPPGTLNINFDPFLISSRNDAYPDTLIYTIVAGKSGLHYLTLHVYAGTGNYTLTWRVIPAEPDDNVPGVALLGSPVTGSLDEHSDVDDLYYIDLQRNHVLTVALGCDAVADVFLFGPGLQDVQQDDFLLRSIGPGDGSRVLRFPVTQAGRYYLDVYLWASAGDYTLEWRDRDNSASNWPLYD